MIPGKGKLRTFNALLAEGRHAAPRGAVHGVGGEGTVAVTAFSGTVAAAGLRRCGGATHLAS
jgi:hypothetical protein